MPLAVRAPGFAPKGELTACPVVVEAVAFVPTPPVVDDAPIGATPLVVEGAPPDEALPDGLSVALPAAARRTFSTASFLRPPTIGAFRWVAAGAPACPVLDVVDDDDPVGALAVVGLALASVEDTRLPDATGGCGCAIAGAGALLSATGELGVATRSAGRATSPFGPVVVVVDIASALPVAGCSARVVVGLSALGLLTVDAGASPFAGVAGALLARSAPVGDGVLVGAVVVEGVDDVDGAVDLLGSPPVDLPALEVEAVDDVLDPLDAEGPSLFGVLVGVDGGLLVDEEGAEGDADADEDEVEDDGVAVVAVEEVGALVFDGDCVACVDGVALVVDLTGTVVVDVEGSGFRRRFPPESVALSRAGLRDALVSSVETCMLPVAARFGPRSSASPVLPLVVEAVDDVDVDAVAPSDLVAAAALAAPCCACAASFFLASALVSARRRPAALPARLSLPPER